MKRSLTLFLLGLVAIVMIAGWYFFPAPSRGTPTQPALVTSQPEPPRPTPPTAAEILLEGYGDASTPPIEDLRTMHRVVTGYFSLVKDSSKNPIGGNADLAAALRGENPNREIFVKEDNKVFNREGLLQDRWGTPLIVHPEGWRQIEFRSAGPDKIPYNEDDLILTPSGLQKEK